MEKIVNILEEMLPYISAWGGGIIAVLLGAFFNHRFTQNREQKKWLVQHYIGSLNKCMLLLRKINNRERHCSIPPEKPGGEYQKTIDPINPDKDFEVVTEMCAEIETEIDFLIINYKLFGRTRYLLKSLESNMEEARQNNQFFIEKKWRNKILEVLHEILTEIYRELN